MRQDQIQRTSDQNRAGSVTVGQTRRDAMAKAAAPYIHPRLAVVEFPEEPIRYGVDATKLSDEELIQLERIMANAQNPIKEPGD